MASSIIRGELPDFSEPDVPLTSNDEARRIQAIKEFIAKHHLDTSKKDHILLTMRGKKNQTTLALYHSYFLQLGRFASRIGDFQTACICDRSLCPLNPLPALPSTLSAYIRYKSEPLGKALLDNQGNPVKDVNGTPMKCVGHWKAPTNLEKFRAAISTLHHHYEDLHGPYVPECARCIKLTTEANLAPGDYKSCPTHSSSPRVSPIGNPTLDAKFTQIFQQYHSQLKSLHTVRGSCHILPSQLRQMRELLLNSGNPSDHQTFVMIIIGIKLFLRADELLNLKIEDFNMDYAIVHPSEVRAICVSVQGKTDDKPHLLTLFKDDETPEFCPIRALFSHLKTTGIKTGYLFPSPEGLQRKFSDTNNSQMSYKLWLRRLRKAIFNADPEFYKNAKEVKAGTHTLRKTGYLFAVWGVEQFCSEYDPLNPGARVPSILYANILASARHSTISNAAKYAMDCSTLYHYSRLERFTDTQRVSTWKSIHTVQHNLVSQITRPSAAYRKENVAEQASWYFAIEIQVSFTNCGNKTFYRYYHSTQAVHPTTSLRDQIRSLLNELSPNRVQLDKHESLIERLLAEHVRPLREISHSAATPNSDNSTDDLTRQSQQDPTVGRSGTSSSAQDQDQDPSTTSTPATSTRSSPNHSASTSQLSQPSTSRPVNQAPATNPSRGNRPLLHQPSGAPKAKKHRPEGTETTEEFKLVTQPLDDVLAAEAHKDNKDTNGQQLPATKLKVYTEYKTFLETNRVRLTKNLKGSHRKYWGHRYINLGLMEHCITNCYKTDMIAWSQQKQNIKFSCGRMACTCKVLKELELRATNGDPP